MGNNNKLSQRKHSVSLKSTIQVYQSRMFVYFTYSIKATWSEIGCWHSSLSENLCLMLKPSHVNSTRVLLIRPCASVWTRFSSLVLVQILIWLFCRSETQTDKPWAELRPGAATDPLKEANGEILTALLGTDPALEREKNTLCRKLYNSKFMVNC